MKKELIALFFYMLYAVAMMRPILPVLEYYANQEYIVTVLCENRDKPALACGGKCYLEKQMAKVSNTSQHQHDHSSNIPQIDTSKYPVAPIEKSKFSIVRLWVELSSKWYLEAGTPQQVKPSVFRPPHFFSA